MKTPSPKIIRFLSYVFYFSGLAFFLRLMNRGLGRVPILMYHSIQENNVGDRHTSCLAMVNMVVWKDVFEQHLKYLSMRHTVIGLDDFMEHLKNGKKLPHHPVVITFDDGFRDNYLNAIPALKRYGLSATFFIIGDTLTGKAELWPHMLYRFLDHFSGKPFVLRVDGTANFRAPALDDAAKRTVLFLLRGLLSRKSRVERLDILSRIAEQNGTHVGAIPIESEYMLSGEIDEIRNGGNLIGMHSMSHEHLGSLPKERQKEEILGAMAPFEHILGNGFLAFSYPFGTRDSFDETTKRLLKTEGFDCAVSTTDGLNGRRTDVFALRRIEMRNFEKIELAVQLSGVFGDIKDLARRILSSAKEGENAKDS